MGQERGYWEEPLPRELSLDEDHNHSRKRRGQSSGEEAVATHTKRSRRVDTPPVMLKAAFQGFELSISDFTKLLGNCH